MPENKISRLLTRSPQDLNVERKVLNEGILSKKAQHILGANLTFNTIFLVHRQGGKTFMLSNLISAAVLGNKEPSPVAVLFAAELKQAKRLYEPYFNTIFAKLGGKYDEKIDAFRLNRSSDKDVRDEARIVFGGANDRNRSNRGATGDVLVGDEYGDWEPGFAKSVFFPMGDVKMAFTILTGTPRGPNHFKDDFLKYKKKMEQGDKDYFAFKWTIEDSLREGEISKRKYDLWRERYSGSEKWRWDTEYMLDFDAATPGRVFAPFLENAKKIGNIGVFDHEFRGYGVETSWDLGVNGTACLIYVKKDGKRFYLKCFRQLQNAHFVPFLTQKVLPYVQEMGLKIERNIFPHDSKWEQSLAGDSILSVASKILPGRSIPQKPIKKMDEAVDKVCRQFSRCYFDERGAYDLITDLSLVQFKNGKFLKTDDVVKYTHTTDAFVLGEVYGEPYENSLLSINPLDTMSVQDKLRTAHEKWTAEVRYGHIKKKSYNFWGS